MKRRDGNGRRQLLRHAVLALVSYVPVLASSPGRVSADTKSYLYLDPGRLLSRAPYLWDSHVGLGTVTHQTIGYLFPMGPWYWAMDHLGVSDAVAQRLWLATLMFAAGAGVLFLARVLGWHGAGPGVAAVAYALSPYLLDYAARISAILLPWAGLGWMIGATALALRRGGWRWPAVAALVVALTGSVNATSLALAGIGPLLWVAYSVGVVREVPVRRAAAAVGRIGLLSVAVSMWWIVALAVQGRFGIPILRYTETYEAVSRTSTPTEILRGLGYWFFYGRDKVAPWVGAGSTYTQSMPVLVLSFAVPAFALLVAGALRFAHRAFVLALLVVGTVVSVGAFPYAHPSVYGRVFKWFVLSPLGLSMRSTPRAVPLVALAEAVLLGVGVAWVAGRAPRLRVAAPLAATALVGANLSPLFLGHLYTPSLLRAADVPDYWHQAAAAIDAGDRQTRVLETPGIDFADYRWGGTVDPITPGLTDRPYVARELIPYGSAPGADLLNAYEGRLQDDVFEPAAVAPIARLLSVGAIVVRNDLQYERYRTPRPKVVWRDYAAAGLGAPQSFGTDVVNHSITRLPLLDEIELTLPPDTPEPPAVAVLPVPSVAPIVHAEPAGTPTIVAGDGSGLVDLAAAGLLDQRSGPVVYAATAASQPGVVRQALADGAHLVVTDTNRRQARRWGSVRENLGYTETAGETPIATDLNDNRLDVFPQETDDDRTVTVLRGVRGVQATGYGNPVTYTPEDRASNALDGDPHTAWRVGAFTEVTGERLEIEMNAAVTTDHLTLLQPIDGARNRWITRARLRFDGGDPLDVTLDASSRALPGQRVEIGSRRFSLLSIEILATNFTKLPGYQGLSAVGFAEVGVADVRADEIVRLPTDILDSTGAASATLPLTLEMTRVRSGQLEPNRGDPELSIARTFTLPTPRTFAVRGQARLDGLAPDAALDAALGLGGDVTAVASGRLLGDPRVRAAAAIDGDPSTAWTTAIDEPLQSISVTSTAPVTADHLDLQVVADGHHSVPTQLTVSADGGPTQTVAVPAITDDPAHLGRAQLVRVPLAPVTGSHVTVAIAAVRRVMTVDYFGEQPVALPVAVAELGLPGVKGGAPTDPQARGCRDDLLQIDGQPVPVRLGGTAADAAGRASLTLEACSADLWLDAGTHEIRTAVGRDLGIDVDRLVLDSPVDEPARPGTAPTVRVVQQGATSYRVAVDGATTGFWLVLGQSFNAGWRATTAGASLGAPQLVDGYANAWYVNPGAASFTVELDWTPQHRVNLALAVSAAALVVVLALAFGGGRGRRAALYTGAPWIDPVVLATRRPSGWVRMLALAAVPAVVTTLVAGPLVGLGALALAVVVLRWPRWRRLAVLTGPAALGLAVAYMVAKMERYHLPTDLEWPRAFGPVPALGWAALAFACVLAVSGGPGSSNRYDRPPSTDDRFDDEPVATQLVDGDDGDASSAG